MEVGAGNAVELSQIDDVPTERPEITITSCGGYEKVSLGTPERLECSRNIFGTLVGEMLARNKVV